jgi:hypothetical protein
MSPLRALLPLAALSLAGCFAGKTVEMGQVPAETAHYVIVKTKWTGSMVVFDCVSRPDGKWDPTCRQVKMISSAEAALSGAVQKLRGKDEAPAEQK